MKFLLILLLAVPVLGQTNLKEVKTFRVAGDAEVRRSLIKTLSPYWTFSADSLVVVEYRPLSQTIVGFANLERGELTVYIERDGRKSVLWEEVAIGGAYKASTAKKLAKKLRSALKKS